MGALSLICAPNLPALNPAKSLTQYTRTVWTQEHGLPQDTIRAIVQTSDGNLWLGTDEGLARFDGYEFAVFNKDNGDLPGNSVTALAATPDGTLWIGTANGLTCYKDRRFHTYTVKDGLADNSVAALVVDHKGAVWIVAGIYLSRFQAGKFTTFAPGAGIPLDTVRSVAEDRHHVIWVAGYGGVARLDGERFVRVLGAPFDSDLPLSLLSDRQDNLWIAGSKGLYEYSPSGSLRRYDARDGLPDPFVRSLWQDRDGNIWAGTNNGLSRLENGRFRRLRRGWPSRSGLGALHLRGSRRQSLGGHEQRPEPLSRRHLHCLFEKRRSAQRRAHHRVPGQPRTHLGGLSRSWHGAFRSRRFQAVHHRKRPAQQRDFLHP